jgi:hypothetical protein
MRRVGDANLFTVLAGGALAADAGPLDVTVNTRLRNHYDTVNAIFGPGKYHGDTPEQLAFSIGTWALGRMMDKPPAGIRPSGLCG